MSPASVRQLIAVAKDAACDLPRREEALAELENRLLGTSRDDAGIDEVAATLSSFIDAPDLVGRLADATVSALPRDPSRLVPSLRAAISAARERRNGLALARICGAMLHSGNFNGNGLGAHVQEQWVRDAFEACIAANSHMETVQAAMLADEWLSSHKDAPVPAWLADAVCRHPELYDARALSYDVCVRLTGAAPTAEGWRKLAEMALLGLDIAIVPSRFESRIDEARMTLASARERAEGDNRDDVVKILDCWLPVLERVAASP